MIYLAIYFAVSIAIGVWAVKDDKELFTQLGLYPADVGTAVLVVGIVVVSLGWPVLAGVATYKCLTQSKVEDSE